MIKNVKLIGFDLDGTLANSLGDICNAVNYALRSFGFPERELAEFNHIVGNGHYLAIVRSCPEGTDEETIYKVMDVYLKYYDEHCGINTVLYDGIEELIDTLRDRGYKLAVMTNKVEETAVRVMNSFFPEGTFAVIQGNREDLPLKPLPDCGLWVCDQVGVKPEETVYVGDIGSDMVFSKNAEFFSVGASWGFRGRDELLENGADIIIDHPMDLIDYL